MLTLGAADAAKTKFPPVWSNGQQGYFRPLILHRLMFFFLLPSENLYKEQSSFDISLLGVRKWKLILTLCRNDALQVDEYIPLLP